MGKIYVVGLGPGNKENMTFRAYDVLKNSDIIIGYKTYVDLIEDMFPDKKIIKSYMKKEVARCEETLKLALEGNIISLASFISSGLPLLFGLYRVITKSPCDAKSILFLISSQSVKRLLKEIFTLSWTIGAPPRLAEALAEVIPGTISTSTCPLAISSIKPAIP